MAVTDDIGGAGKVPAVVTSFANHKGGVGKTLLMLILAFELARRGRRLLLIDLDSQGNLSRRLGYLEIDLQELITMAECLRPSGPEPLSSSLLPCRWEVEHAKNITLAPSRIELEQRGYESGSPGAWMRLRRALAPIAGDYDDILIDTPPSLGHFLHMALVASDYVVAPTTPEYDPIQGVHRLQDLIEDEESRQALTMTARLIGVIVNGKRAGVALHDERTDEVRETWGDLVWDPTLPLRAPLADAVDRSDPPQLCEPPVRAIIEAAGKSLADRYLKEVGA